MAANTTFERVSATTSTSRRCDAAFCCHGPRPQARMQPRPAAKRTARSPKISSGHAACSQPRAGRPQCFASTEQLERERRADSGSFAEAFERKELLGQGSFGSVYRATERATGADYAAKIVPKHRKGSPELDERIARRIHEEVETLRMLQSRPEAVRLVRVYEDEEQVTIVTELCEGGDLEHFLKDYGRMMEAEAAHAAHDILEVLRECHRQGICYADVKPANFLLKRPYSRKNPASPPLELRVVDFGCSQRLQESGKLHKRTGTPLYMAPELFMRYYGVESDQWATGIMVYQLLSGHLPFWDAQSDRSPFAVMSAILNQEVHFDGEGWEGVSEAAKDFVARLLDRDYNSRMSADEALAHPWIAQHCDEDGCSVANNVVQLNGRSLRAGSSSSAGSSGGESAP